MTETTEMTSDRIAKFITSYVDETDETIGDVKHAIDQKITDEFGHDPGVKNENKDYILFGVADAIRVKIQELNDFIYTRVPRETDSVGFKVLTPDEERLSYQISSQLASPIKTTATDLMNEVKAVEVQLQNKRNKIKSEKKPHETKVKQFIKKVDIYTQIQSHIYNKIDWSKIDSSKIKYKKNRGGQKRNKSRKQKRSVRKSRRNRKH
jgi:hypothetical protein